MSRKSRGWLGATTIVLLLAGSVVVSLPAQTSQEAERIAIQALKEKLESGETFLLIDVREDFELEADGAIRSAIHIPMGELESRMDDIPKDIELVFY